MTSDEVVFPLAYLEPASNSYLRQGDVVANVPLIVAPPRITLLARPERDAGQLRAQILNRVEPGKSAYAIVQVTISDAIILTYDCDIDGALYSLLQGQAPADDAELLTVAAAVPINDYHRRRFDQLARGKLPRYALLPQSTVWPGRVVDFATMQQLDIRVLLPSAPHRLFGLTDEGQLRLHETIAHSLGDVFRRGRNAGDGNPSLLPRAYNFVTGATMPGLTT